MKFQFKIHNIDIIDCSSCPNTIYPDPESREVLFKILQRVCSSDVVAAIGKLTIWLDDIELQSPNVYGKDYEDCKKDDSRYNLQTGMKADFNKITGLFVENEDDARKRIKESSEKRRYGRQAYHIEPGLKGIKKAISYINSLYENKKRDIPDYLKSIDFKHFRFDIDVIWGMNRDWKKSKEGIYNYINNEHDGITAGSSPSGCYFSFSNFGGDAYHIFASKSYLEHLNKIQKILDGIAPGIYEADPYDRDDLLKAGFLKREGRKHIIPNDNEAVIMEEKIEEILLEKARIKRELERLEEQPEKSIKLINEDQKRGFERVKKAKEKVEELMEKVERDREKIKERIKKSRKLDDR